MARQSKKEKEIDALIERTYYRHGSGVQINILDIPKVFRMGREALASGRNLDDAIKEAIAQLRVN